MPLDNQFNARPSDTPGEAARADRSAAAYKGPVLPAQRSGMIGRFETRVFRRTWTVVAVVTMSVLNFLVPVIMKVIEYRRC